MNDKVTNTLSRGADEEIHASFGTVRPTIMFRCANNKLEGLINVDTSVDYDYSSYRSQIRLRFDDGQAITEHWGISKSREAVFVPSAKKLID